MSKQTKPVNGTKPVNETTTKEPIDELTDAQVQKLIAERKEEGGICKEVTEDGEKFLMCQWPSVFEE
jgi:hypothetical protein